MNLNKIDLNKLNAFLEVVEHGGVGAAATRLLLTRSAVSQRITSLERTTGLRLFNRVGKRLLLTGAGRKLHAGVREYQAGLQRVVDSLDAGETEVSGLVRVGLFIGFSKERITGFLTRYLSENPGTQVKLLFASQPELRSMLVENRIDFALSIHRMDRKDKILSSTKLFEEELLLVSGRKLHRTRPSLKELQRLPVIDYYQSSPLVRAWIRHHYGRREAPEVNIRAFGGSTDFVLELILRDAGVGVLPRSVAKPFLDTGRLLPIRSGRPELRDVTWLSEIRGFRHESAARVFGDRLKLVQGLLPKPA